MRRFLKVTNYIKFHINTGPVVIFILQSVAMVTYIYILHTLQLFKNYFAVFVLK